MEKYDLFSGLGNSDEGPLEIPEYMNMEESESSRRNPSAAGAGSSAQNSGKTLLKVKPDRKSGKQAEKNSEKKRREEEHRIFRYDGDEDDYDYESDYAEGYEDDEDEMAGRSRRGSFHALAYVITAAVVVAAVIAAGVLLSMFG